MLKYKSLFLLLFFSFTLHAQHNFESSCQSLDDWQILDLAGDGHTAIVKDPSVPPGYGPNVIEFKGDNIILFANSLPLANGYIQVLWKDPFPNKKDADGILMFRADFPQDLAYVHNTKEIRPQYWLEQDQDSGTSLRYREAAIPDQTLALAAGKGLTFDTQWNPTGWFWQKIKLDGDNISVKFWSVTEPEPKEWILKAQNSNRLEGRFGVRCWSGQARVVRFIASDKDVTNPPPPVYLHTEKHLILNSSLPSMTLFLNTQAAIPSCKINLSVKRGDDTQNFTFERDIDSGSSAIPLYEIISQKFKITAEGFYTFSIEIIKPDGFLLGSDQRTIEYRSNIVLESRIQKQIAETDALLNNVGTVSQEPEILKKQTAFAGANSLLKLGVERLTQGEQEQTNKAVNFADKLINSAEKLYHGQQHDGSFSLKFGDVSLSSASLVIGQTYEMTVPWIVSGQQVTKNLQFRYHLCNEYGQILATQIINPESPTSTWKPGTHQQNVQFTIPIQTPPDATAPIKSPRVFTGKHYLTVSVHDTIQTGPFSWTLLDNPESIDFFNVGRMYTISPVYITVHPVEILSTELNPSLTGCTIGINNLSKDTLDVTCAFDISTVSGRTVYQRFPQTTLYPGKNRVNVDFKLDYYGELNIRTRIIKNGSVLTKAEQTQTISLPESMKVIVHRLNHVIKTENSYKTPVNVTITPAKDKIKSAKVMVSAENEKLLETTLAANRKNIILDLTPNWGYYDLLFELITDKRTYNMEKRIVSTVVETQGTDILINGEPFIMKGVNVHGMWGNSRELTRGAMEILKDCGFNTLRGDHPNLWLVDLAHEENLCWMALADFSCDKAENVYARFDGSPLAGLQEISRQFIIAYRENAGVVFWNSCNEIDGDLDEFLLTLYPCYKTYDPYNRPVNYANLYGQDNWRGQDIMGINYYFGLFQKSTDRQPIVEKSINTGFEHNLPVIYTEFNSFWGPDELTGLDAISGMGQWGLDNGMSGGTFYKLTDVPGSHPGLLDAKSRLEVHQPMAEAFKKYHADAEITIKSLKKQKLLLEIRNKRRFTLRNPVLTLKNIPIHTIKLNDISPECTLQVEIDIPSGKELQSREIVGELGFESHFGLKNNIDVNIFLNP